VHESTVISRHARGLSVLHDFGLTWTQFDVLLHLWLFGDARMGDLRRQTGRLRDRYRAGHLR
jgi:hypothetical protein